MNQLKNVLLSGIAASALLLSASASAEPFDIPEGTLSAALDRYTAQTGVDLAVSAQALKGVKTRGVAGTMSADEALSRLLSGTGFVTRRVGNAIAIVRASADQSELVTPALQSIQLAQAAPSRAAVETVTVTSSKLGGADVQSIPIAITALSQEQLTSRQIAGGPDLIKEVPNLTFTKTNFTGYSIQIRGIGTQAISVTTDPAVAVSFNDTPFIRNHFFEQEFYDVAQVEILRGPQGTLYGRNATAGVVNVTSAKPTDQFEAMGSVDIGNYHNRRMEGMINLPLVSDKLDLRVAGEWTKRDGYSFNSLTDSPIDGRDLWSTRASLRWQPTETFHTDFVWEHFQEDDNRLRSAKQLCDRADVPPTIFGQSTDIGITATAFLTQICKPVSMYSPAAFGVPNSLALPYYGGINGAAVGTIVSPTSNFSTGVPDAYASTTQSHDLRVIESTLNPKYLSKNDTLELNSTWNVTPSLIVSSETGYNRDFLWSTEDFNRFNTQPGIFAYDPNEYTGDLTIPDGNYRCGDGYLAVGTTCSALGRPGNGGAFGGYSDNGQATGYFCDPQLGCSNRLVGEDLSEEHAWQLSQELRLSSSFEGPFNFSVGGNYMHYETEENYYVFFNTLTMFSAIDGLGGRVFPWDPHSPSPNQQCLDNGRQYANPNLPSGAESCLGYIDPNPLSSLDNAGHNYFLSQNPYNLNSYAAFGEAYYNVTPELKLTAGLRFTDDQKHFVEIPSELLTTGYGYPVTGVINQEWTEWTGRFVANWSPKLDFTDQTMLYASYAHGYKAGGANPPGAVLLVLHSSDISNPAHPATFAPEFNDAFELGTKNTLFDGAVTLNGDVFYYDYKGYQISQIVDRTSVNLNFNATSMGAELTATWEPVPGLKFGFNGGYEHTRLADGSQAIDLMDRTAGHSDWVLVKPMVTQASNCVVPAYVVGYMLNPNFGNNLSLISQLCGDAYNSHIDPVTAQPYTADIPPGTQAGGAVFGAPIDPSYKGFDPLAGTLGDPYTGQNTYNGVDYGPVPNNGAGFYKNLSGNELPNAPHYTMSLTADYTVPVSPDWAATLHTDFYWQSQSWARVYNDDPYDRIRGYTNLNLALILTDSTGWQVMGYLKNVFDTTAITGTFLNSDDTGLTTNIFLTDPRLFGVRVTKRFGEGSWENGGGLDFINDIFTDKDGGKPRVWLTVGGNFNNAIAASNETYVPDYIRPGGAPLVTGIFNQQSLGPAPAGTQTMSQLMEAAGFGSPSSYQKTPNSAFDWQAQVEFQPEDSDWVLKAGIRYGRSGRKQLVHKSEVPGMKTKSRPWPSYPSYACTVSSIFGNGDVCRSGRNRKFIDAQGDQREQHTIMDFDAGVNIGIGMFGQEGQGTISGGLRVAQFKSSAHTDVNSDPEYVFTPTQQYHNVFESRSDEDRSFHGMGPEVSWEASQPFWGNPQDGQFTIDWGANAGVLFGRQSMNASHFSSYCHENGYSKIVGCVTAVNYGPGHSKTKSTRRTHRKVVPNLGGYIGASARYNNAKISFGYRADTFFGAMDGGQETAKDYNRGFYGPYMNVSIGLGG